MDYPKSVPSVGLVNGKFVDENSVNGTPGSLIPAAWGNSITDEVVNVVKASGLVPDEADPGQLLLSIQKMNQSDSVKYALDTGGAGVYVASYVPAVKALLDGVVLRFKAQNGNTGASTFSPNGLTAAPIVGAAHSALQGGEIVANGDVWVQWNSSIGGGSWILIDSTGGALQVAPATKSQQAVQLSQVAAITGATRNGRIYLSSASATATYTANEIVVKAALGNSAWVIPSFSKTINLASTGAGGMDTGSAPVSGYVAIYAIYNPTTSTSALLAIDATSAVAPEVYGGVNMPAGYSASALLTVVATNASSQLVACTVFDRRVNTALTSAYTGVANVSGIPVVISASVPKNAKFCQGELSASSTSAANLGTTLTGDGGNIGQQNITSNQPANTLLIGNFFGVPLPIAQTVYLTTNSSAGTPSFRVYFNGYEI